MSSFSFYFYTVSIIVIYDIRILIYFYYHYYFLHISRRAGARFPRPCARTGSMPAKHVRLPATRMFY